MIIANPNVSIEAALGNIPKTFQTKIIKSHLDVKTSLMRGDFGMCNLKAGRFCEVMIRFLQHQLTGSYIPFTTKISNFKKLCEDIENLPGTSGPEGLRILLPRALVFLYSIRNKRDSGHVGGEVDANSMDAEASARLVDWCLGEVIRTVHSLSIEDAENLVKSISSRKIPEIWTVMGKKRVLEPALRYRDKVLLLLYATPDYSVPTEDLYEWIEHPGMSNFKSSVLAKMHAEKLIEYDRNLEMVIISPIGIREVEAFLSKSANQ